MPSCFRRFPPILLLLLSLVVMPAGCGWYYVFNSPPIPEYRQPSGAELEYMTKRMMGQAPKREAHVSTDGVQVVFQTGHAGGIRTVALSPNGRYIASSGQDAAVKIWDVAGGQEIRTFTGYGMLGADRLVFSADSTRLITAEMTSGIKVIELATGREVLTVGGLMANGVALSGDGRTAAGRDPAEPGTTRTRIGESDRSLTVVDLQTGRTLWTLPDSETQSPVALNPDGTILLTSRIDTSIPMSFGSTIGSIFGFGSPALPAMQQELLVWDLSARKLLKKWPVKSMTEGAPGNISPDSRWLLREDHTSRNLIVTDLETGKPARTISTGASSASATCSSLLACPSAQRIWKPRCPIISIRGSRRTRVILRVQTYNPEWV